MSIAFPTEYPWFPRQTEKSPGTPLFQRILIPAFTFSRSYASTPLFLRYSITSPTVFRSVSSSAGISTLYSSSRAITSSNRSRESAPRSSLKDVSGVIEGQCHVRHQEHNRRSAIADKWQSDTRIGHQIQHNCNI